MTILLPLRYAQLDDPSILITPARILGTLFADGLDVYRLSRLAMSEPPPDPRGKANNRHPMTAFIAH